MVYAIGYEYDGGFNIVCVCNSEKKAKEVLQLDGYLKTIKENLVIKKYSLSKNIGVDK